jgi:hypothetical protein
VLGREGAADREQRRGLAGTVRAHEERHLPGLDLKAEVVGHRELAVADRQITDL